MMMNLEHATKAVIKSPCRTGGTLQGFKPAEAVVDGHPLPLSGPIQYFAGTGRTVTMTSSWNSR